MNISYPNAVTEEEQYRDRYTLAMERIAQIREELTCPYNGTLPSAFHDYFLKTSAFLLYLNTVYTQICSTQPQTSLYTKDLTALQDINHRLYEDILPAQYDTSYANPAYAVSALGTEYGLLLCLLYTELRGNISYFFEKRLFYMTTSLELYIEIYNLLEDTACTPKEVERAIYYYVSDYADTTIDDRTRAMLDPTHNFAVSLISTADLTDLRYLYFFGEYISENELKTAKHLNEMTQDQIDDMASTFTEGFRKGFQLYNIDLSVKKTVSIRYQLGFERIVRAAIRQFAQMGLETTLYRGAVSLIHKNNRGIRIGFTSTSPNPQYDYDHRLDEALILDKALTDRKLAQQRHAYETRQEDAKAYAGPAVMEVYGETPFSPVSKPEAADYTAKQQKIRQEYQAQTSLLGNEYMPGDQISFTIISYPVPAIGAQYEEIFDATVQVNTLDSSKYEQIQTTLIHALDQGDYVTITGRNGNHTDLQVALHPLNDPVAQTDFENCLADVNIPLGEVFTSPQLEQTHGILHVTDIYLNQLRYRDLELTIKNGVIDAYHCANFTEEEENQKFIRQNLLMNHPTLPMGEFAIGTNTTAYAMGRHFDISHLLPILIAEKTGPHFAFGDTCFSHEEDLKTYNPDGKQMIAKDNAYSLLRHTEPQKAYFNCHTDITIPYHELDTITVHCADGHRIPIIANGRFVLPGTESLNEVLPEE